MLEEKYSAAYGSPELFGQAYRDTDSAASYLKHAERHPKEAVEYTKEICRYLVDTYGRFPAHTDAFYLPGTWVQFSHLDIEYYEKLGARRRTQAVQLGKAQRLISTATAWAMPGRVCSTTSVPPRSARSRLPRIAPISCLRPAEVSMLVSGTR